MKVKITSNYLIANQVILSYIFMHVYLIFNAWFKLKPLYSLQFSVILWSHTILGSIAIALALKLSFQNCKIYFLYIIK